MSKYEKALDEVLGRAFKFCGQRGACDVCCVIDECVEVFEDSTPCLDTTKEEFVKKIKEELLLPWEE
ncbi:hypothetical protein [Clostridium perfringens]|uniref:hypothetical protein n=1 Tax=Clostridium perfringens TaxID=1502 RepID=UPI001ABB777D|nr:hypothetical protein [Clostridium perfringens]MBO3312840.1 hypothetical protein [Clostridium perfringens]MDH5085853.1 hypothetical protein [Clostridium perfringens]WEV22572.1 hypothetical protein PL327_02575 [Clostridium perfringens D]